MTSELLNLFKTRTSVTNFFVGYNSTEVNNNVMKNYELATFEPDKYDNCVGLAAPYMECKIVDENTGRIVPHGAEGVLFVRSYSCSRGYWNDEENTRKAFDANGWLYRLLFLVLSACFLRLTLLQYLYYSRYNTGDCLAMDSQGNLYFRSRRKELITARGSGRQAYVLNIIIKRQ